MTRAGFARPHSADGDPRAQERLCAGMATVVLTAMEASLAARTLFFDDQVSAAIEAGLRGDQGGRSLRPALRGDQGDRSPRPALRGDQGGRPRRPALRGDQGGRPPWPALGQVVILGAGYDDRALRFRTPGVTFFELDHPDTQAYKRARLDAILAQDARVSRAPSGPWPVLVAADFGRDDVARVLRAAGHDPARPTLFLCEGLLVYLDEPTTVRFLSGVRTAAAEGSVLAASLSVHAEGLDSAAVVARGNARRRTADAEPFRTILPAAAQADLLASAGWRITATVDAADLGTGAEPGRSLLVTAAPRTQPAQSSPARP
jgi:methyltransferase (TIGR00027 family)